MKRRACLVLAVSLLCPATAAHALPVFSVPARVEVAEGDAGHVDVEVPWALSAASADPVQFTWRAEAADPSQTPGVDFIPVPPTRETIAAGQTSGKVVVRIFGDTHYEGFGGRISVGFSDVEGARTEPPAAGGNATMISIADDDPPVFLGYRAADDYFQAIINGSAFLDVAANDGDFHVDDTHVVRLLDAPRHGTLAPASNGGRLDSGTFRYTPAPDFSGRDRFRYALCYGECTEAEVIVDVNAFVPVTATRGDRGDRSGLTRVGMDSLPALAAASFTPSTLARPQRVVLDVQPDPTPQEGWDADSNIAWFTGTLPASPVGATREYRVVAVAPEAGNRRFQVSVGVDSDGDQTPSLAEKRCEQTRRAQALAPCETTIEVASAPVDYWVAARALNGDFARVELQVFEVRMDHPGGGLVATGPGHAQARAPVHAEVSWTDDSLLPGDRRLGFVRVRSDAGTVVGDFPFWVEGARNEAGLPLAVGEPRTFDLAPESRLDRIFIDVPEGATRLDVASLAEGGMDFHLVRMDEAGSPEDSGIAPAPGDGQPPVFSSGLGDERGARVEGAALRPGRWYVVPRNDRPSRASVRLSALIEAVAPLVRPGSYFNPGRRHFAADAGGAGDDDADGAGPVRLHLHAQRRSGVGNPRAPGARLPPHGGPTG